MPSKPNLNDLQLILLSSANQREDGSILPPPDSISDRPERLRKAIPVLLRRQLIVEAPVTDRRKMWREENEESIGLVISAQGRAIIADGVPQEQAPVPAPSAGLSTTDSRSQTPTAPRAGSKIEIVVGLLRNEEGATLTTMVEATGWLPHTTRAALTGLRKKGHCLTKSARDGTTVYHIAKAGA